MYTIKEPYIYEQIIKKSTFLSFLAPVASVDEALLYLENIKQTHPNATHHCFAYVLGDKGHIGKFSDDGEPSQTAGIVIYDVLKKNDMINIICVVVRYYGGIKLGAGGLIRAYKSSASLNLAQINPILCIEVINIVILCDYAYKKDVEHIMHPYELLDAVYLENVKQTYKIPKELSKSLILMLNGATKGNIVIEVQA